LRVEVNGEPVETDARDLAALCKELGFGDARIATALNGEFVPSAQRAEVRLDEGDAIEIVAPRQGG
jgi:sulfur carrier protein